MEFVVGERRPGYADFLREFILSKALGFSFLFKPLRNSGLIG